MKTTDFHANPMYKFGFSNCKRIWLSVLLVILMGCFNLVLADSIVNAGTADKDKPPPHCNNTIKAEVVALEQTYFYNRFGAFNPSGMIYALRRDVVVNSEESDLSDKTLENCYSDGENLRNKNELGICPYDRNKPEYDLNLAGNVKLRSDKRPRPLVLRVNEGDCLEVTFTNLLARGPDGQSVYQRDKKTGLFDIEGQEAVLLDPKQGSVLIVDGEDPTTRHASMHVNGLNYVAVEGDVAGGIMSDGSNVGRNPPPKTKQSDSDVKQSNICSSVVSDFGKDHCSLAAPGETRVYRWYAKKEGSYLFYSMGGPAGGEGDGGQLGLGLFGSINVQPEGAKWYRSQVTEEELAQASTGKTKFDQPIIDYEATFKSGLQKGEPILNMLKCSDNNDRKNCELIYSDLNAVIDIRSESNCTQPSEGDACGKPYREFTTIFHDEITAVQAFRELADEDDPIAKLKDGMGINYGAAGVGSMVLANRAKVGPAANCPECKLEEFFLTSWVNGDPALVLGSKKDSDGQSMMKDGKVVLEAKYPSDPSNVHHSYVGDPVRFRNMHAGPKETHVFHLHAHQWLQDKADPNSVYLDSQTISPGASFSYEIQYGGSGNRNFTVGDSIFHCHLYPHFAQGMWELWRSHDVFESGAKGLFDVNKPVSKQNHPGMRNLPDAEIADGTPNPAVVPLPRTPMPPMPSAEFRGYPFYIAGQAGHRPPQPPLDLDDQPDATTLQRHIITDGTLKSVAEAVDAMSTPPTTPACNSDLGPKEDLYDKGRRDSACIAKSVRKQNDNPGFVSLAKELDAANIMMLPLDGTAVEKTAMKFHEGELIVNGSKAVNKESQYKFDSRGYPTCDSSGNCDQSTQSGLFYVNGKASKPGAPYSDPCPGSFYDASGKHAMQTRHYRAAYIQFDMQVNKEGWHDPQARIALLEQDIKDTLNRTRPTEPLFFRAKSGECIQFAATNLVPSNLNLDDFQVFSPTDVIGQHIHLVKFDVTSSDGSGNGWNYEDGTLAADEIRDRIAAYNKFSNKKVLKPKTHAMFKKGGAMAGDRRGYCSDMGGHDNDSVNHPWCGAQTTVQRWWADPLLNKPRGEKGGDKSTVHDRTIRTVFTHDHFGPSSHQHHGLYAALVVEPTNSKWTFLDGKAMGGADKDGKPTLIRADGGPTSYAANVIVYKPCKDSDNLNCDSKNNSEIGEIDQERTAREFNLAFADFAIVYDKDNWPINPPNRIDHDLPLPTIGGSIPMPEAISASDPGTQLINYRNEPIPLRIVERDNENKPTMRQKTGNPNMCRLLLDSLTKSKCMAGDKVSCNSLAEAELNCDPGNMANVFSSKVHASQRDQGVFRKRKGKEEREHAELFTERLDQGLRKPGDPATPLLLAYAGDRVQIRLIQGGQEENHTFNMHGVKWLSQPDSPNSGYMNGQPIGISEHFEFNMNLDTDDPKRNNDYLYSSWAVDNLWDGQWGILRSYGWSSEKENLKRLPSNPLRVHKTASAPSVCPTGAPLRKIDVVARAEPIVYHRDSRGETNVDIRDEFAIVFNRVKEIYDGTNDPSNNAIVCAEGDPVKQCYTQGNLEPLILRAKANDCIYVTLRNELPNQMLDKHSSCEDPKDCTDPNNPQHKAYIDYSRTWSYNTLPPITPSFNFNQITSSNRVSLHPQLLSVNIATEDGGHVGFNEDSTVGPGDIKSYTWYAGNLRWNLRWDEGDEKSSLVIQEEPVEFGIVGLRDMGDVIKHSSHGAIGALIVEPKCSSWIVDADTQASATVEHWVPDEGGVCGDHKKFSEKELKDRNVKHFREFVLLYQDDLSLQRNGLPMPNLRNADDAEDTGQKAFNYRTEPIWSRLGADPAVEPDQMLELDWSNAFSSYASNFRCVADPAKGKFCDPQTPLFKAKAGEKVRFRVAHVQGKPRNHGFTVFGHDWQTNPWECSKQDWDSGRKDRCNSSKQGSNELNSNYVGSTSGIGPSRHFNILTTAGGDFAVPGDYMYRTQEGFQFAGGLWGIFCVEGGEHRCDNRGQQSAGLVGK